jgi:hypothetical protein
MNTSVEVEFVDDEHRDDSARKVQVWSNEYIYAPDIALFFAGRDFQVCHPHGQVANIASVRTS